MKPKIRKCKQCNRWFNGCYDTDCDFWSGEKEAGNCKYFKSNGEYKNPFWWKELWHKHFRKNYPEMFSKYEGKEDIENENTKR